MRTYAVREGMITDGQVASFERMCAIVERIPDLQPTHLVSCHAVTRIVSRIMEGGPKVIDGWFAGKGCEHSWIDLDDGVIADLYPVGGACPFLVCTAGMMNPWRPLYAPRPQVVADKRDLPGIVDLVLREMGIVGATPTTDERKTHAD